VDADVWNPRDLGAALLSETLAVNERGAANKGTSSSSSGVSAKVQGSKQQDAVFTYKRMQMPSKV
jgi:hypothetical protein